MNNFSIQKQLQVEDTYGDLRAALPWDRLVYEKENVNGTYELDVYDLPRHALLFSLQPPIGQEWGRWLSVCAHPSFKWMAVVQSWKAKLDIYDAQGKHFGDNDERDKWWRE